MLSEQGKTRNVCLFNCSVFSQSPEKTLALDLVGTARMKRNKRLDWNGALTALAHRGLGTVEAASAFLEVYLCENSQATQSEAMSGLFSQTVGRKGPRWLCLRA